MGGGKRGRKRGGQRASERVPDASRPQGPEMGWKRRDSKKQGIPGAAAWRGRLEHKTAKMEGLKSHPKETYQNRKQGDMPGKREAEGRGRKKGGSRRGPGALTAEISRASTKIFGGGRRREA